MRFVVLLVGCISLSVTVLAARRDAWRVADCPQSRSSCHERDKEVKAFIASHVPSDLEHNGGTRVIIYSVIFK